MLLEDGQNAAEENPSFKEQLHALDKEINCSPGFPKLNPKFSRLPLVTDPLFSHATSSANVSKAYLDFIRNKMGREVDFLETIRADEFKVGQTSINKEKKGSHGRPKKSAQEESFNVDASTLSSSNNSFLPTRISKRNWKRVTDKKLHSLVLKDVSPDLGEKRKVTETKIVDYHSIVEEKKQKIEVSSTTQTAEVAQQPRQAQ